MADEKLSEQARNNSISNFKFGFDDIFIDKLIGRMDQNQDIFTKIRNDRDIGATVKNYILKEVYQLLNR